MAEEYILESMVINKGFCRKILGDIDLEGMAILVCYDDQVIAEINYEKDIDNMEIEIVSSQERFPKRIFSLDGFFKILEEAKQLAIKCAKEGRC
ncbi:MAG: hypothetical protein AAGF04_05925 [Chlamydiota bacterium]